MRRIRMKKSRKYEQDKLQAAINASARRALDDLEKSSGMLSVTIEHYDRVFQKWQKNIENLRRITKNFGNLKKNFKNMREGAINNGREDNI